MKKVPASEATRKRLESVFSGEQIDPSRIVREAAELQATTHRGHCATAFAEAASTAPKASSSSTPLRCAD